MLKKIPIGQSDFKTVVTERYYVDKTLYIKDIINADTSLLVTRPRRFGKMRQPEHEDVLAGLVTGQVNIL